MANDQITVRLKGKNAHPDQVRAKELGLLLIELDNTIWGVVESEPNKKYDRKEVFISLIDIKDNCVSLQFKANHIYAPVITGAYKRITEAIHTRDYTGIPKPAREGIKEIHNFTARNHVTAEFLNGTKKMLAKLDPRLALELPSDTCAKGSTTVYAEIQRVGGVDPKIALKLDDGPTLHCDISKDLAKTLSTRLYEVVALQGEAQWDVDWNITSFKVTGYVDGFEEAPISESFAELKGLIGKYWDDVDPDEAIADLRRG
ncbi:MAG: hypothetical protein IPP83_17935 [Flavobacteriales bacterium]|nr:hypothetical protein [Flavobacteriales bacterium]